MDPLLIVENRRSECYNARVADGTAGKRILIIDDNRETRDFVQLSLTNAGYNALAASTARSGLDQVKGARPHLILLDVDMPDMDAFDVLARLGKDEEAGAIPVVMMTGRVRTRNLFLGYPNVRDFLAKPFSLSDMIATVQKVIEQSAGKT